MFESQPWFGAGHILNLQSLTKYFDTVKEKLLSTLLPVHLPRLPIGDLDKTCSEKNLKPIVKIYKIYTNLKFFLTVCLRNVYTLVVISKPLKWKSIIVERVCFILVYYIRKILLKFVIVVVAKP